ncbi:MULTISPECIES: hypothetical protein [Caballeronia]|jgi:Na+/H+ antiporter NhaD/arsenite permease-like protein|nr:MULTISPECIES: hypothetical protein [Caballeronia]MCG7403359.1 hypothetical protein [Caballeronia zhejiangensis]MCI1044830.1 hypothetical protein [Caballeronia zhejiangensis]MDR5790566.1 hypothetical protein [Caballeronia sp. LP003]MDR5794773.1 hypothetical protein [Caballeronia sp. LZ008]
MRLAVATIGSGLVPRMPHVEDVSPAYRKPNRYIMRKLITSLIALLLAFMLGGCATTVGNIALGMGLGAAGTLGGIYCALAC